MLNHAQVKHILRSLSAEGLEVFLAPESLDLAHRRSFLCRPETRLDIERAFASAKRSGLKRVVIYFENLKVVGGTGFTWSDLARRRAGLSLEKKSPSAHCRLSLVRPEVQTVACVS